MSGRRQHVSGGRGSRAVTTSRSGGQASTVAVLLFAAAGVGWFWWRRHKANEEQSPTRKQGSKGKGNVGGRSAFRFPAMKSSNSSNASSSKNAFNLPAAAAAKEGGARKGNPKKANKKQRREEKAAKKEAKGKGFELIHNSQIKTKEEEEGPVTVKYVDMSKTSDMYDKVREFQETGKKRYP